MYIYFCVILAVSLFAGCNQKQDEDFLKLGEDIEDVLEDGIKIIEDKTVV